MVVCYPVADGRVEDPALQMAAQAQAYLIGAQPAQFVWVSDGKVDYYFDITSETTVASLPSRETWRQEVREELSTSRRLRLQAEAREFKRGDYQTLQSKFNELHEEIYKKRAGVSTTNEAIDEVGKIIFLKIHSERHPDYNLDGKRLADVLKGAYVRKNGIRAVEWLAGAFKDIARLTEYQMPDMANGGRTGIFPPDEPFRLNNAEVIAFAVEIFEDFQLTVDQDTDPGRVSEDLLGWAFNTFLRGKYDSSGGLATYLTRKEVVDCMIRMAFHDILDSALWEGFPDRPTFLMGDICCGTGSFLVGALAEMKRRILQSTGYDSAQQLAWLQKIKEHSIFGADASPGSITKAHLNLLTFGSSAHRLLRVEDSITDSIIDRFAEKFDLLETNPPFGKNKYDDPIGLEKMRSGELQLGWNWTPGHPEKKKALTKADPAALFIDRNLQLLKPGGRLLIVVPDGLLSNAGDRNIREYLMGVKDPETGQFYGGKAIVKAVVSLPTQTFAISGTGAKTSFIYLQKKRHEAEEQGPIFMAVAEHVGYIKKGNTEVRDPDGNDLLAIADAYVKGR
ncbi:MAG: SAM-dependent DNA methyltransferase [Anaerolineae bacterium]|nr:SAM-dependent DNA methyltransferase [Anaerolineae bacterium]